MGQEHVLRLLSGDALATSVWLEMVLPGFFANAIVLIDAFPAADAEPVELIPMRGHQPGLTLQVHEVAHGIRAPT